MNESEFQRYLKDRYQDQVNWYGSKSRLNKDRYDWSQSIAITLSASIPFLVVFLEGDYRWIPAIFSTLLTIDTAILKTFKFQENWIHYRTIAETLKKEEHYYDAEINEYNGKKQPDKQKLFVERVEKLISRENTLWIDTHTKQQDEQDQERGQ